MATVLVVEDDKLSQRILGKILSGAGHTPLLADSGQNAWDALRQHVVIDLVILDSQLGRNWGWEFLRDLRQDVLYQDLPVVVYTAHTERSSILKYAELGMKTMLVKPYKAESIFEEINKALKAGWASRLMETPAAACARLKIQESDYYSLVSAAASSLETSIKEIRAALTGRPDDARVKDILQQLANQSTSLGMPSLRLIVDTLTKALATKSPKQVQTSLRGLETLQHMLRQRALAYMGVSEMVSRSTALPFVPKKERPQRVFTERPATNVADVFSRETVRAPIWAFGGYLGRLTGGRLITADEFDQWVERGVTRQPVSEILAQIPFISRANYASFEDLEQAIGELPGFKAVYLEIASQLFGRPDDESSDGALRSAINRLGVNKTCVLIVASRIARAASQVNSPLELRFLLSHTVSVTLLAYEIARMLKLADDQLLAVAGAVHDLGKWFFAVDEPALYALALSLTQTGGKTMAQAEKEIFGRTHEDAGKALLAVAKASPFFEDVAAFHNNVSAVTRQDHIAAVAVVHLANHLAWAATSEVSEQAQGIHTSLQVPGNAAWKALSRARVQLPMDLPELFEALTAVAKTTEWISGAILDGVPKLSETSPGI